MPNQLIPVVILFLITVLLTLSLIFWVLKNSSSEITEKMLF